MEKYIEKENSTNRCRHISRLIVIFISVESIGFFLRLNYLKPFSNKFGQK